MRFSIRRLATAAAMLVALGSISVPAFAARAHASGTSITVTMTEFKFKLSKAVAAAPGAVTFTVVNKGALSHDFKIGGKKTALIKPGKRAKLTVTLKKGKFAYLCTVAGHAQAGMKGIFTVK